jgi:hypothetical protein
MFPYMSIDFPIQKDYHEMFLNESLNNNVKPRNSEKRRSTDMVTIRIACLPWSKGDPVLNVLYEGIATVVRSVPSAKIEQENDLLVLYEEDLMPEGLGHEVLVEILDIP